jgi:chromosomal replication initiator protein
MKADQAWKAVLGQLQVEMPKSTFDTWVSGADFVAYEDGSFVVGVSNAYARDWLESRLKSTATRILTGMMNRSVELRFIVWQQEPINEEILAPQETQEPTSLEPSVQVNRTLNTRYTFENFVVGSSNRLAHAAALAVAEQPAKAYNPLFLYGQVGLGKTHLLHAIGNHSHQNGLEVLFVSSEEFTNDLIHSIRKHNTVAFREKYRNADVLLIDDVQFIAGKESTQEEFFHTFNTLHGQNKQIVISSDRSPKAFITLEERLRSRFGWGLIADIQSPDKETRLAILRSKAEHLGQPISDKILEAIASKMQTNIRELEGALNRAVAYANLRSVPLTTDMVDSALIDLVPDPKTLVPEHIIQAVALAYGISKENLLARDRSRKVALPRQVAMYLLREETQISLPQIGEALGGRDHTTIMYGHDKITELIEKDDGLRRQVAELKERLYSQAVAI